MLNGYDTYSNIANYGMTNKFVTPVTLTTSNYVGTKLNIDYSLDDLLDEDQQEDIYEYFMEAESDNIQEALDEFDGEYDEEELRLMRIKFINEVAN